VEDRIALIDLDGTVADYDKAMAVEMARLASPEEDPPETVDFDSPKEPHVKAREELIRRQPGFWRSLPKLELGFEIVEDLETVGFGLHVLTRGPSRTTSAWTEKVEWCHEHLPQAAVTITQDKALVYGRVLVDDWPPFMKGWLTVRPRGLVVCVAHPWNAGVDHPQVFRYDGTNREALRERLHQAFCRVSGKEA